ncbi:D-alanyl-D-alanine carboxypeptidase [Kaistia dalseonensis]|uniref:D-alanyl-D-alanine carboxypeptidase n=1 Tax=Kaistia dalseonensis TaxID=410840 RepID=A0ABU0H147_9HYPH|nr:D-alanyl-D-alanine carboxypeptidase [Kaistia dalseonensis]MCX5493480.1 D-alanyl-D-alanine carboxypeptidase [Kaistia dalseonensis]MDQ0436039.1 D-alanyl-D-alanine carboxypeptidase [Kaistia dalseonensis]
MLKAISPLGRHGARTIRSAFAALLVIGATIATTTVEANAAPQSAIVVDAKTGKVLYAKDPDGPRHPASLTKMMTLYLLFGALDSGKLSMSSQLKVSTFAARQSPTKLGLKPGSTVTVRDAMLGLITRSANDAAVVIAENLDGTEAAFARRMTSTARSLGMSRTTFRNASGLPNPNQWTTARDMTTLGRALQERYPSYYRYFSTRAFVYRGQTIGNHNKLLGRVEGVDGIKTGYTNASGFNLVTSLKRDNRYVVAAVMGGSSGGARDRQMVSLLDKYVPQAYAGGKKPGFMVAKAATAPAPAIEEADADTAPVVAEAAPAAPAPRVRPQPAVQQVAAVDDNSEDGEDQVATASVAPIAMAEADPAPSNGPRMVFQAGPSGKPVATPKVVTASIAGPVPTADNDPTEEGGTIAQGDTEDNSPPVAAAVQPDQESSGWKIQIAAAPSQDGARSMLDTAKSKGGKVLADATPVVETFTKGDATFYRARFAGFDSKDEARAACAYLTKRSVSCLAIRQ